MLSSDTSKATFSNDTSKATFGNDTSKATFSNNTSNATFSSGSTKTTFSNGSSKPTFSDGSTKPTLSTLTSTQTPLREQNSISSYFVGSSQRSEVDDNDEFDVDSCVVVSTGLNRTKRAEMSKFLKHFGISTSNVLDENVTHVVVDVMRENCAVRTLKYIQVRNSHFKLNVCTSLIFPFFNPISITANVEIVLLTPWWRADPIEKKMLFSVLFYNTKESTRTVMNKSEKKRRIIFVGNFPPQK